MAEREPGETAAMAIVAACALLAGGLALIPPHGVFREPSSATKTLAIVAIALVALAAPLAIADGLAQRRFAQAAARVRAERAWERETRYEGPEGRGLRFEAAGGEAVLLLEPVGGLGSPRLVRTAPPAPTAAGPTPA